MVDGVIVLVLFVLVYMAVCHILKVKSKGGGCIGCPSSSSCKKCNCGTNK